MGTRREKDKSSSSSNQRKIVFVRKEAVRKNEGHVWSDADAGRLNATSKKFSLLDFPTLLENDSHLNSRGRHGRSDVGVDVKLEEVDSRWPQDSIETANWANSFRFELDRQDVHKMQAILGGDVHKSRRNSVDQHLTDNRSGSFQLKSDFEEVSEKEYGHLKPPRQLEKSHGSFRSSPCATADASCEGGEDCSNESHVKAPNSLRMAVSVPNPPGRGTILRRLCDLKTQWSTPRVMLDDEVSYNNEMAVERDNLRHRLKSSLLLLKNDNVGHSVSSSLVMKEHSVSRQSKSSPQEDALGELDIMPISVNRKMLGCDSSASGLSGGISCRLAQEQSTTPTSTRFKPASMQGQSTTPRSVRSRNGSIQEQIVSIQKRSLATPCNINDPTPYDTPYLSAAIPFKWEEEPGKPKSIDATANRALSDKSPLESMKVSNFTKIQLDRLQKDDENLRGSPDGGSSNGDEGCIYSHRFYGRGVSFGHSRQTSMGLSSRSHGSKEPLIDLDGSAAAKFLVEQYDTPINTPSRLSSSPTVAVPFDWEYAPGKSKIETSFPTASPCILQLPPRLAVPYYHTTESFSRELRVSHPEFAGFFASCLTASSPVLKQSDRAFFQYASSKSLPPRVPQTVSPSDQRRRRHGFLSRCISTPLEGCQMRLTKSFNDSVLYPNSSDKSFGDAFSTPGSPGLKPKSLLSSETKRFPTWAQKGSHHNAPSSPTSILCGPEGSSSQTSTSASNNFFSGDLGEFTRDPIRSASQSASKSSSSHESIEEDFVESENSSCNALPNQHSAYHHSEADSFRKVPYSYRTRGSSDAGNKSFDKQRSQKHQGTAHNPEVWSPEVGKYFQFLKLNDAAATTASTSAEDNSCLLDKRTAPTSSGYLNCEGEPLPPKHSATRQSVPLQASEKSSALESPKRPSRLPYTMPSVAEQILASCTESTKRQLIQDLSPRLLRQYSGRKPSSSQDFSANAYNHSRAERHTILSNGLEEASPSPAYAAALDLLSPAANHIAQRWKGKESPLKASLGKPRRRVRFLLSMCKTLKRVLSRQRRRKSMEPMLTYRDGLGPTTFQFIKPN
ncbi:uncharacterized protein [Physcomitrium patens]|uniref:Uncharacterized protein n=1 Tax=Physcomitrium patens TaxID=3218 RepID=A0A7I4FRG5_PHYPA|nr:uncharacterized protein LOC112283781 [Physcomitrium patens]XP_024378678.1 uncharacterized protein LOC112283781 [Physcomitrium patens]|eukprot:XP_024378677.1 uncharacterized protein LOC112283781 [Physcomitrella patens]